MSALVLLLSLLGGCGSPDGDDPDTSEPLDTGEPSDLDGDGWSSAEGDCDDQDASVHPEAPERCNGEDDDCDDEIDENAEASWFVDEDSDGYGDASTSAPCDGNPGLVDRGGDCDDADAAVYPGATDLDRCDGIAQDCSASEILVPEDHPTIQAAIDASRNGDRVCVGPGTWAPIRLNGKAIQVIGREGIDATIIDADGSRPLTFADDETRATVVEGFTLIHGDSTHGGGADLFDASPTLRNLRITQCSATFGGGISSRGGDPLIENVQIEGNQAGTRGGGVHVDGGSAEFTNVWIVDNIGGDGTFGGIGGGAYLKGDVSLKNVRIERNRATAGPGGVQLTGFGTATLENVVIVDNEGSEGGGINLNIAQATFQNTTIVGNTSPRGGGIYAFGGDHTFTNSILAYNSSASGGGIHVDSSASTTLDFAYSMFYGNTSVFSEGIDDPTGSNENIRIEPGFVGLLGGPEGWDLRATEAVDLGDPSVVDPDGSRSDIGAYGGPGAGNYDLDLDGAPHWWQPTGYTSTEAAAGWDCNDADPTENPADGCS